jgi:hypothetical protein
VVRGPQFEKRCSRAFVMFRGAADTTDVSEQTAASFFRISDDGGHRLPHKVDIYFLYITALLGASR